MTIENSASAPDAIDTHTPPMMLVSFSEPNAVSARNRRSASASSLLEPSVIAAAAVCARNRACDEARIASRSFFISAHWVAGDGLNGSNGVMNFAPTSPGQMSGVYNYVVGATKPPPGNRGFDIRLGMQRGTGGAGLLVAGTYSDQLLVTISVAP